MVNGLPAAAHGAFERGRVGALHVVAAGGQARRNGGGGAGQGGGAGEGGAFFGHAAQHVDGDAEFNKSVLKPI